MFPYHTEQGLSRRGKERMGQEKYNYLYFKLLQTDAFSKIILAKVFYSQEQISEGNSTLSDLLKSKPDVCLPENQPDLPWSSPSC